MKTKLGNIELGQKLITANGYTVTVTSIIDKSKIVVQYYDRHFQTTSYSNLIKGSLTNVYHPNNNGMGWKGLGDHPFNVKINGKSKHSKLYELWTALLKSMYNPKMSSYGKQTMCRDWLNFQEFCDWYELNYYELPGERLILTNNLIDKNNTVFSPETTFLLPETIFKALSFKKIERQNGLPLGVRVQKSLYAANIKKSVRTSQGTYVSRTVHLGGYQTPEEAFEAYKQAKENYLKELAERYIDYIPYKAYDALYKFKIESND